MPRGSISCSTYAYTDAGDLTSLALATGSGTVPSYTLGYSAGHQLASETTVGTGYAWQPPAAATDAYAAVNTLNQYPSWTPSGGPSKTFTYDGNGNVTAANIAGVGWTLAYDPENKLVSAGSAAGTAAAYAYDVLGRRTHKSGTGVTETYFLDDGTDEIAEYTGAGAVSLRYVPGAAINEPIASVTPGGQRRFFQTDHHGSVVAMGANNGTETEGPYTYDPFGNGVPTTGVAYKYVGMRLDPETGFYYDRARYYIPALGRFPQPNPVGYTADLNLYPYASNDPTDKTDPTGQTVADLFTDPRTARAAEEIFIGVTAMYSGGEGLGLSLAAEGGSAGTLTPLAAVGAAVSVTAVIGGAAVGIDGAKTLADIVNKSDSSGDGESASQERASNRAKGIPDSKLGPSGKPKVHTVRTSTRKAAFEGAKQQAKRAGGRVRFDAHPQDGQKPHFQAEDAKGSNVKPVVHFCPPNCN